MLLLKLPNNYRYKHFHSSPLEMYIGVNGIPFGFISSCDPPIENPCAKVLEHVEGGAQISLTLCIVGNTNDSSNNSMTKVALHLKQCHQQNESYIECSKMFWLPNSHGLNFLLGNLW